MTNQGFWTGGAKAMLAPLLRLANISDKDMLWVIGSLGEPNVMNALSSLKETRNMLLQRCSRRSHKQHRKRTVRSPILPQSLSTLGQQIILRLMSVRWT